jgi:hypothetical protein
MRKLLWTLGLVAALAIPAAAIAADWANPNDELVGEGAKCKGTDLGGGVIADGAWYHFVNNQLRPPPGGKLPDGELTAEFSDGSTETVGPSLNNGPTQHFLVFSGAVLEDASTNLPGRLLLSSIECKKKD